MELAKSMFWRQGERLLAHLANLTGAAPANLAATGESSPFFSGPGLAPGQLDHEGALHFDADRRVGVMGWRKPEHIFTDVLMRQAWLFVKRAKGGAGVDGVTLARFEENLAQELAALQSELIQGRYRPQPVRRVMVPKSGQGLRPIAIWAMRDHIAQRAVYQVIAPSFEEIFLPCSYGFRPDRSTHHALTQVQRHVQNNLRWVVDADIQNCFEEIDSRRLLRLVKKRVQHRLLLRYVGGWLSAGILNSIDGVQRQAGASQGSVLSPLFANIYLHELDAALLKRKLALVRYADDFVICCRRKQEAMQARDYTQEVLTRMGLTLHPQKSQIVHVDQGFGWLGHFFVGQSCYRIGGKTSL